METVTTSVVAPRTNEEEEQEDHDIAKQAAAAAEKEYQAWRDAVAREVISIDIQRSHRY